MRRPALVRPRLLPLLVSLGAAALLAGCAPGTAVPPGLPGEAPGTPAAGVPPPSLTVTPADGSQSVSLDTPVTVTASAGVIDTVSLHRAGDRTGLAGNLSAGGRSWALTGTLAPGAQYVVTASAHDAAGSTTLTAAFTTAAPRATAATKVYPYDGMTVGVGMPVILVFDHAVAAARQSEVTAGIQVQTSVPVAGAWHWFTPQEVHWRPRDYWPAHTRVTLVANLGDVDLGGGLFGTDFTSNFTVGDRHVSTVDAATHQMVVTSNDQVVHQYPVSTGRDTGSPTINGTLFVWYKLQSVRMVSTSIGIPVHSAGGYDETVYWDTSISSDGYYIHAAPWSVDAQGRVNVSHGCVNLSTDRAIEFFKFTQVGDIVVVENTGKTAGYGDGEADWQIPFDQYAHSGVAAYPAGGSSFPGGL